MIWTNVIVASLFGQISLEFDKYAFCANDLNQLFIKITKSKFYISKCWHNFAFWQDLVYNIFYREFRRAGRNSAHFSLRSRFAALRGPQPQLPRRSFGLGWDCLPPYQRMGWELNQPDLAKVSIPPSSYDVPDRTGMKKSNFDTLKFSSFSSKLA